MEQILTATARGALETGNLEDSIREFGELKRRFPKNPIAKKHLADLIGIAKEHLADLVGKPTEAQSVISQIPTPPEAPQSNRKNNFLSTLEAALQL